MGYALLWLEALAGELLLLATLVAVIARIRWPWLRRSLLLVLVIVAEAAYAGLLIIIACIKAKLWAPDDWGQPVWPLVILCGAGAVVIPLLGVRRVKGEPEVPAAARWPWGKLAVTFGVVLALNLMTFWNLDAAVKQRADALRVEAGALALSVAPPRVPDRDNAALVYEKAFEFMGSQQSWSQRWDETWRDWVTQGGGDFDPEDPNVREFLEDQASALATLREAVDKPACYFHHDYARPSIAMLLPEVGQLHRAALLLALDARRKTATGDVEGAIDDVNALFAIAEHERTVPLLVVVMGAGWVEHLAADRLQEIFAAGKLSPQHLARVKIPETRSYQRLVDRGMRMEEAFGLSTFYEYGVPLELNSLDLPDETGTWATRLAPLYRVFLLDQDVAAYRALMEHTKQMATLPFHVAAHEWEGYEDKVVAEARGVLTHIFLPALGRAAELAAMSDARHRLSELATAIALAQTGTGDFPDDLGAWASIIRPDPFDGKPLKWTETDDALVLYSIGPDRKDDGGRPFDEESRTGDITFSLPK